MKIKRFIRPVLMALVGFIAAKISFIDGVHPFGYALLCVQGISGDFFYIFSGCILGAATLDFEPANMLFSLVPYAVLLPEILLLRKIFKDKLYFHMLAALLACALPALIVPAPLADKITCLFSGLISACLIPILKRLWVSMEEIESRLCLERADILSLCLVGGLAVSSLPKTDILSFNLCVFALLATSSFAVCAFGPRGSIWASVCGIIWVIKGGDALCALCLISGGIIAGMLEKKRGGILLGFILGDLLITLFSLNKPSLSLGAVNIALGCGYTVFLKKSFVERLGRLSGRYSGVNDLEMNYIDGLRRRQKAKLESAGRMYTELANAFVSAGHDDVFRENLISAASRVCDRCKKNEYCSVSRKSDTLIEFGTAADELLASGKLSSLPLTLTARCIQPVNLLAAFQAAYKTLSLSKEENGENEIALQLKSISELLFSLADELDSLPEFDREKEKQVRELLSSRIGGVTGVICKKSGESHTLEISMKKNCRSTKNDICLALENGSAGLYRCLSGGSDKSGGFTGIFAPVPKFSVDAFALRENKKGEEVCGDSFTLKSIDNDRYLAAISDGAGSGKRAQAKSESALDLLEAFSDTGIKRNEMFKTMNRLLLSKCNPEEYSTMDVTELDLDSGMLYWTKIGAVPGYILRQGKVEKVQSDALPIGIVTRINPTTTKKLLQKDDIIVLVSDGIYDGLCKGNDDAISLMLPVLNSSDPKILAENIMKKAKSSGNDDDMTVMVLKINAA